VHLGGEDLRSTHHPNEIAQAEAATGKTPFVKYWIHGAFLLVNGGRMGKSLGNAYTISDLQDKGFAPLDLRYFYMTGHYRKQLNFTFDGLRSAQTALKTLREHTLRFKQETDRTVLSEEKLLKVNGFRDRFDAALADDLNMPAALAVVWEVVKSNIPGTDKYDLLIEFDEVLGLQLNDWQQPTVAVPAEVWQLVGERDEARKAKNFLLADNLRERIKDLGFEVEDKGDGSTVKPVN
jgi:cysteinyl-tRNA synthetase